MTAVMDLQRAIMSVWAQMQRASVRYWKELHSSVLIACTTVAELVNKAGASGGQGLPRDVFYGAFNTETKHIHH